MARLGDYIKQVNVRNRDLKVTKLQGLSMSKQFRPSTSNIVGVDLSKYKVVNKNVFAFDTMSVIRVHKVPIAINESEIPIIISPAYITFKVIDENVLNPQYLKMWFNRSEFDRYADFKSDAAVRGGYDWSELCDTPIEIPPIEKQKSLVKDYTTLTNRISLNERLIATLESTAQTLYRKTFVDNIDPENLPEGWKKGKFTDIVQICSGGTPNTKNNDYWEDGNIPFYTPGDRLDSYYVINMKNYITEDGLKHCNSKLYPKNTTIVTARGATTGRLVIVGVDVAMNQTCYAIVGKNKNPFYVHQLSLYVLEILKQEAVGATFDALVVNDFSSYKVLIPPKEVMSEFDTRVASLYNFMRLKVIENNKHKDLQSLLLSKMVG